MVPSSQFITEWRVKKGIKQMILFGLKSVVGKCWWKGEEGRKTVLTLISFPFGKLEKVVIKEISYYG